MSGKGNDRQSFRYPTDKWQRLGEIAESMGTDRSALIRQHLDELIAKHEASGALVLAFSHPEGNTGRSGDTRRRRT